MTCVIGIIDGPEVYLGADSVWTWGAWQAPSLHEKVFLAKLSDGTQIGVGLCGAPRILQVLRYCMNWADIDIGEDPVEWLVTTAIPAMRGVLKEQDAPLDDEGHPGSLDGNLLVAVKGRIFEIHGTWQVSEPPEGFAVIGIDDAARGAIHAARQLAQLSPGQTIMLALEAASRWSAMVGPPFKVWTVG